MCVQYGCTKLHYTVYYILHYILHYTTPYTTPYTHTTHHYAHCVFYFSMFKDIYKQALQIDAPDTMLSDDRHSKYTRMIER